MGTGNGVIISVPLSESSGSKSAAVKDILSALSHNQPAALNEEDDPSPPPALSAAVPVYRFLIEWIQFEILNLIHFFCKNLTFETLRNQNFDKKMNYIVKKNSLKP